MVKVCFLPISSSQLQRSVPVCTFVVLVPANPFTTLPDGLSSPTKSSLTCEIHPEHRLSIPIVSESVSNWAFLSVAIVVGRLFHLGDVGLSNLELLIDRLLLF